MDVEAHSTTADGEVGGARAVDEVSLQPEGRVGSVLDYDGCCRRYRAEGKEQAVAGGVVATGKGGYCTIAVKITIWIAHAKGFTRVPAALTTDSAGSYREVTDGVVWLATTGTVGYEQRATA